MYFEYLVKENIELWNSLESKKHRFNVISYQDRKQYDKLFASETKHLITFLRAYLKEVDFEQMDINNIDVDDYYSEALEREIKKTCQKMFDLDVEKVDKDITDQLMHGNRDFIAFLKEDGIELDLNGFSQAIRNLWVMNFLQLCYGLPIKMTRAMYAYSMLYPLTDNYLDDTTIDNQDKKAFCERFKEKIAHDKTALNEAIKDEVHIFKMIDYISEEYSREEYEDLFLSLLSILDGQILSMGQYKLNLYQREEVMNISFYKGGSSVLADAYLIKGHLTKEEESFAFSYGVLLQMIDDLEDIKEDTSSKSMTLPVIAVKTKQFEGFLNQLSLFRDVFYQERYTNYFEKSDILQSASYQGVMDLMNYAIGNNKEYLSYREKKNFQSEYKYTFKKLVKVRSKREKEMNQILKRMDFSKLKEHFN